MSWAPKESDTVENWDVETATSDTYAAQFDAPRSIDFEGMGPAPKSNDGTWKILAEPECWIEGACSGQYLQDAPVRTDGCASFPVVWYDSQYDGRWWAVMNQDAEIALVEIE
ncbi:hypothetical protein [Marinobacter sp.]|uniref:hypothetical protein n=1 Tax=Marinobacter sp. TaxID=50741 RepID=UPI001B7725BD|nr:hypothetical protein [Marinobacter sp.]MBQ0834758.1 hypothetical protein [Marinobacter sp.]